MRSNMFDIKDRVHLKNLQKILSKAKIELDGAEILAAADVIRWVGILEQKIEKSIKDNEITQLALNGEQKIIENQPQEGIESLNKKRNNNKK